MLSSRVVVVGLNDDVHFDYKDMVANDFHIQGTVHSSGGIPPKIMETMIYGDPFTGNWSVTGVCLQPLGGEDWFFQLDFITDGLISYCQWIHFGILFNVDARNIIANLVGWWTCNGNPLMPPPPPPGMSQEKLSGANGMEEYLQAAVTGFDITGPGSNKMLRIMNNTNMPIEIRTVEVAVSNMPANLAQMSPEGLGRPGEESPQFPGLSWVTLEEFPRVLEHGQDILIPLAPKGISMGEGQFLLSRGEQIKLGTKDLLPVTQQNKSLSHTTVNPDWGWFWEQHGE
jgi:hypothetical protein